MNWVCHKCSYSVEIKNLTQIAFCPNCGAKCENVFQSDADSLASTKTKDVDCGNNVSPAVICPICCSEITAEDESIACIDCKTRYHEECWNDNNGCATYGCKSAKNIDVHAQPDNTQSRVPCPWCHTLLLPKTVICSSCGKRTDQTAILDNELSWDKILEDILVPIKENLCFLWKDICFHWQKISPLLIDILRHYKETISRYTQFDGVASRKEYLAFVLISLVIYSLLIYLPENYYLAVIYLIGTIIPTIALVVRRLRDTGLSGWFAFAIPVLPLLLLVPEKLDSNNQPTERE